MNQSVGPHRGWILDRYERKARLAPAVLTILAMFPGAASWGVPLLGWIETLVAGSGLVLVLALLMSHSASLAGNRFQEKLWPKWPHDSPTNKKLNPFAKASSAEQRSVWFDAIKRLTGIDIATVATTGNRDETQRVVQDAIAALRAKLRDVPDASRLSLYNSDYGFARNLAGLRPVWLSGATLSCAAAAMAVRSNSANIMWAVAGALVFVLAVLLAITLPRFVRQKGERYAEAFFGAVMQLDQRQGQPA